MITLLWEREGVTIRLVVSDDIATCDLLDAIDSFIKAMGREPSGSLDYTSDWGDAGA